MTNDGMIKLDGVQQSTIKQNEFIDFSEDYLINQRGLQILFANFLTTDLQSHVFSARQHICYSALFANARPSVRPSVCPAVCHTGGSVKDGYS